VPLRRLGGEPANLSRRIDARGSLPTNFARLAFLYPSAGEPLPCPIRLTFTGVLHDPPGLESRRPRQI
jgi:hypothetical protein